MDAWSALIELRAIFSGVEEGPDAEVALRDSFDLDRERLRLPALPLGRPFRCDLCAGTIRTGMPNSSVFLSHRGSSWKPMNCPIPTR